jgi:hypothetical protein
MYSMYTGEVSYIETRPALPSTPDQTRIVKQVFQECMNASNKLGVHAMEVTRSVYAMLKPIGMHPGLLRTYLQAVLTHDIGKKGWRPEMHDPNYVYGQTDNEEKYKHPQIGADNLDRRGLQPVFGDNGYQHHFMFYPSGLVVPASIGTPGWHENEEYGGHGRYFAVRTISAATAMGDWNSAMVDSQGYRGYSGKPGMDPYDAHREIGRRFFTDFGIPKTSQLQTMFTAWGDDLILPDEEGLIRFTEEYVLGNATDRAYEIQAGYASQAFA